MENDDESTEEKEEDENEDEEEEEEEEETTPTVPENTGIIKLNEIIEKNHLLPDELIENQNRSYKPFHDDQKQEEEEEENDDNQSTISTSQKMSTLSIDKDYVRAKVKQTLKKKLKQQHRRLCSKGEAALVTAQRRDQRDTIQLHLE